MPRLFACLGVLSVITACSAELTPEAHVVRQIPAQTALTCRFVGPVSGSEMWGFGTAQDAESAMNKLRNQVAEKGGNAFVLAHTSTRSDGTSMQGDAYRCP